MTIDELTEQLVRLESSAGEVDGLSELDHALQCAYALSLVRPSDHELQGAALVHDIGLQYGPDEEHGRLGAEQVRGALGDRVAGSVEAHVAAKRYLVVTDPSYASVLSPVSVVSLGVQGGAM